MAGDSDIRFLGTGFRGTMEGPPGLEPTWSPADTHEPTPDLA